MNRISTSTIQNQNNELLVNRIIRLENLDSEFNDIANKLKLKTKHLDKTNVSQNRKKINYREAYCKESKRIISDLYEDDIKMLNYNF